MLSIGALMVTAGRLADIFGRRRVIVIGLAIFGVVSVVCGSAPGRDGTDRRARRARHRRGADLPVSDRRRVEHVLGRAAERARSASCSACRPIGQALGPFVGGTFSEYLNWRGVFFINMPFCIAAIYLMLRYVKESRDENGRPPHRRSRHAGDHRRARLHQPRVRSRRGVGMDVAAHGRHACRRHRAAGRCSSVIEKRVKSPLVVARPVPQPRVRCGRDRRLAVERRVLLRRGVLGAVSAAARAACRPSIRASCSSRCRRARARRATSRDVSPRSCRRIE